jgi:hypothetical protein
MLTVWLLSFDDFHPVSPLETRPIFPQKREQNQLSRAAETLCCAPPPSKPEICITRTSAARGLGSAQVQASD